MRDVIYRDSHLYFRPRVRAQRKFAQGQGQSPLIGVVPVVGKVPSKSGVGGGSSGSSTASGPSSSKAAKSDDSGALAKVECPKTEDFLTFLCLRGSIQFLL